MVSVTGRMVLLIITTLDGSKPIAIPHLQSCVNLKISAPLTSYVSEIIGHKDDFDFVEVAMIFLLLVIAVSFPSPFLFSL